MARIRERESKKGKRYTAEVRWEGENRTQTFSTRTAAKEWAKRMEAAISDGKHAPTAEEKRRTVKQLLERYKKSEVPKKSDQRNPTRLADFWINRIGSTRLYRLTPSLIVEIRDELSEDKAGSTVNRYLALLSHACTVAEREWGWMDSNPVRKVSRLPESQGRVRYLSDDERERLLKQVEDSKHPYLHAVVLVALTTGARKSEILGLEWKDLDLGSKRAVLQQTKNKERRSLALVPQVVAELKELQRVRTLGEDRVFIDPATGTPSHYQFESAWRSARDAAGITDFRFHDLRHSCASYLAMNGATTAEIAAVLGHKTLQMVKRYSHLSDEHVRGVVERTAEKVLGSE